ncbi:uncharacterized protein TNIN_247961 [Trichonephila inaurata madagascariensis]|uniref:Uncharacterized protein n=1 Tax=Trichonephila inaurata madagascariensis TaxID=2747483 RepID=A0A8X6MM55_9ARAC|nr:uncharacterized protein TNIN_247961 [Trichonephila inaurata madagascariensis]
MCLLKDEIMSENHSPNISPLLTLTKIIDSQLEMNYIEEMRNMILFQISPTNDYIYLRQRFVHKIIIERWDVALFRKCLYHTLTDIVKSSVLVHNSVPFYHWMTIVIDRIDNPQTGQMRSQRREGNTGNTATDQFLMPTFFDLMTNNLLLFLNRRLNTNIPCNRIETSSNNRYLNPMHECTWRRLYDNNLSFFFCEYDDFILYVKEQTLESRPANVFKEIMERQIGKVLNTTAVLRRIASPYYYVLPHQDEQEYATLEADRMVSDYEIELSSPAYMAYQFSRKPIPSQKDLVAQVIPNIVSCSSIKCLKETLT